MASIAKVFRTEMERVARKEMRGTVRELKQEVAKLSRTVSALKRELASVSKSRMPARATASQAAPSDAKADLAKVRFTSENLRALRKRLGISQREMAQLVKVSTQAVYLWERKGGRLRLRNDSRRTLIKIRQMNRKEVRAWLDSLS